MHIAGLYLACSAKHNPWPRVQASYGDGPGPPRWSPVAPVTDVGKLVVQDYSNLIETTELQNRGQYSQEDRDPGRAFFCLEMWVAP